MRVHTSDQVTAQENPPLEEDDVGRIFRWSADAKTTALFGILIIALFFALRIASDVFMPIVFAAILNLLLSPLVRFLKRFHVPAPVGGGLVIAGLLCVILLALAIFIQPASEWFARAPQTITRVEKKVSGILKPFARIRNATERVTRMTSGEDAGTKHTNSVSSPQSFTFLGTALSVTSQTAASLIVAVVLLYFLLSSGDLFLTKVVHLAPHLSDKKRAVEMCREMEAKISRYLIFVTGINAGLGTCVGLCQWLLGMPNPALWGVLAFTLNFIPYLGGTVGIVIVGLVSLLSFENLSWAVLPPLAYFVCFFVEGNFVTPNLLGRGMRLNPPVIFIWLMLWGWMWGVFGALLAVPMLVILKIYCDHFKPLAPLGEFLAD